MKPLPLDHTSQPNYDPEGKEKNQSIRNSQSGQNWVGVHIDNKYFLTTASAFEKLQHLDMEIAQEKNKLNALER